MRLEKKYIFFLSFLLTACVYKPNNAIVLHVRYANGVYDREISSSKISVEIGKDISLIEIPNKDVLDSHPGIISGIFVDKQEKTKVKASQLKEYDGSFKDLYVVYDYIDYEGNNDFCINEKSDFDGEYLNYKNEKLTIDNGVIAAISSNFGINSEIEKNKSLGYCVNTATITMDGTAYSLNDFDHIDNSVNYFLGYYSYDNKETLFHNDLTKCGFILNVFYDAACNIKQENLDIKDFIYYKNNTFSIDYDL